MIAPHRTSLLLCCLLSGCSAPFSVPGFFPGEEAEEASADALPAPAQPPAPEALAPIPAPPPWSDNVGEYREGIYQLQVPPNATLDFDVAMNEGDAIVYYWRAESAEPGLLGAEFRGRGDGSEAGTSYRRHRDGQEKGMLRAPFTGRHGWRLINEGDGAVTILLRIAGYYRELPDSRGGGD